MAPIDPKNVRRTTRPFGPRTVLTPKGPGRGAVQKPTTRGIAIERHRGRHIAEHTRDAARRARPAAAPKPSKPRLTPKKVKAIKATARAAGRVIKWPAGPLISRVATRAAYRTAQSTRGPVMRTAAKAFRTVGLAGAVLRTAARVAGPAMAAYDIASIGEEGYKAYKAGKGLDVHARGLTKRGYKVSRRGPIQALLHGGDPGIKITKLRDRRKTRAGK